MTPQEKSKDSLVQLLTFLKSNADTASRFTRIENWHSKLLGLGDLMTTWLSPLREKKLLERRLVYTQFRTGFEGETMDLPVNTLLAPNGASITISPLNSNFDQVQMTSAKGSVTLTCNPRLDEEDLTPKCPSGWYICGYGSYSPLHEDSFYETLLSLWSK